MYLIGLTGNIASGKSTVRRMLEELGAHTIDADRLAHAVLYKNTPAWQKVVDAFGPAVLTADGEIDRQKLGAIVFADAARLRELERITHPAVSAQLADLLRDAREPIIVIEAVKLVEAGLHRFCDAVWVVVAPPVEAKRRLMQERGLTEAEAERRLAAQPDREPELEAATVVIDNGRSIQATRAQVIRAFSAIRPEAASDKTPLFEVMAKRGVDESNS